MKPLHPAIRILQSGNPILMDKFDDLYRNLWPRQEGPEGYRAPEPYASSDDEPAAQTKIEPEAAEAATSPKRTRSGRNSVAASPQKVIKPVLSDEQVNKMVMADSVADLISILDKR